MNATQQTNQSIGCQYPSHNIAGASPAIDQTDLYRDVVEDLTEVVCRFAADGTILFANPVYCRFFGKEPRELLGKRWHPVAVAEDIPHIEAQLATLAPDHPVVTIEHRVYDGEGQIHWMECVNRAYFDSDGRIVQIQCVGRNISDRKRAEEALAVSERRLKLALEASTQGLWDWDLGANTFFLSANYWAYIGYSPDEVTPDLAFFQHLVHPEDWARVQDAIEQHLQNRTAECVVEYRIITKQGETRWVLRKGKVVARNAGGKALRMAGTVTDITARMEAELACRQAEARFACLRDANVVGVVIATAEGAILEANDYYLNLLGYTRDELRGGQIDWRKMTPPDWLPRDEAALAEMRATGTCAVYEKEYIAKDGRRRPVDIAFASLPGPERHILVWVLDITEPKRAKAEIQELNTQLEARVAQRTAELQTANQDLEGFTYAASHDMKAPLGRINSFSRLLRQRYGERLEDDGQRFLGLIEDNALRLHLLVDDLLAHAQIGRQQLESQSIDLQRALEGLLHERADDVRRLGATMAFDIPTGTNLRCNALLLNQVLRNLIDNALKYSATSTPPRIEFGARQEKDTNHVWVRDNGIGIDPIYHEKIFEIFRRLHSYSEYPGTGVGLALVKKAVARMGGQVRVESALGKGTTFHLEWPESIIPSQFP